MNNRIIKKCKDCNKPFSISSKEQQWLKDRGLQPFSRCSDCRKKNKSQTGKKELPIMPHLWTLAMIGQMQSHDLKG